MRVFVTGASGWIGSAVIPEVIAAGHEVVGLARSDESADTVSALGAEVLRGSLDDLGSIRAGAEGADAVIHLAFNHDFSDYQGAGRTERAVVTAIADVLAGSGRPFLFASGLAGRSLDGEAVTERSGTAPGGPDAPRGGGEALAFDYVDRGVGSVALRFAPSVHGVGDHGFLAMLVSIAREKGVAGYVGDGASRWPAVNRLDAATMVALALDKAPAGSSVHAVAEEGIATRDIAEAIGRAANVPVASIAPEDAAAHFGWIGTFFGMDIPASSAITRELLGWAPTHPTLIEDLDAGHYTGVRAA